MDIMIRSVSQCEDIYVRSYIRISWIQRNLYNHQGTSQCKEQVISNVSLTLYITKQYVFQKSYKFPNSTILASRL